jgi:hypothetical protein
MLYGISQLCGLSPCLLPIGFIRYGWLTGLFTAAFEKYSPTHFPSLPRGCEPCQIVSSKTVKKLVNSLQSFQL